MRRRSRKTQSCRCCRCCRCAPSSSLSVDVERSLKHARRPGRRVSHSDSRLDASPLRFLSLQPIRPSPLGTNTSRCSMATHPSPSSSRTTRGARRSQASTSASASASTSAHPLPLASQPAQSSTSAPILQADSSPITPLTSPQRHAPPSSATSTDRPTRGTKRRRPDRDHPTPLVERARAAAVAGKEDKSPAHSHSQKGGTPRKRRRSQVDEREEGQHNGEQDDGQEMRDKEGEKEQRLFDGWREEYFESK